MSKIAVLLHLADTQFLKEFEIALQRLPDGFDLFVNLVKGLNTEPELDLQTRQIHKVFANAKIIHSDNRGMDVGGMFRLFSQIQGRSYQAVLYMHGKTDARWRNKMLSDLSIGAEKFVARLSTPATKDQVNVGMIGSHLYPFDYYNTAPCLVLAEELGLDLETSWQRFNRQHPLAAELDVIQRARWATDRKLHNGRPEIDIEYACKVLGNEVLATEQAMQQRFARQFIADSVYGPLPYFPGNCFWLRGEIIDLLAKHIDFEDEFLRLPENLTSDKELQSRAHAWERMLPVFAIKNNFAIKSLELSG